MSYTPSPAGFWKRYVAYFIDIVILYIAVEILSMLFFSFRGQSDIGSLNALLASLQTSNANGDPPDVLGAIQTLQDIVMPALVFSTCAYFILAGIYFSWMEGSRHQASIGKKLLGIKVTNANGAPIGPAQSIARFLAAGLSWVTMNLGHALAAWTPDRRALHDYIANTRVENVDPKNTAMPLWAWAIIVIHGLAFVGGTLFLLLTVWMLMQKIAAL